MEFSPVQSNYDSKFNFSSMRALLLGIDFNFGAIVIGDDHDGGFVPRGDDDFAAGIVESDQRVRLHGKLLFEMMRGEGGRAEAQQQECSAACRQQYK